MVDFQRSSARNENLFIQENLEDRFKLSYPIEIDVVERSRKGTAASSSQMTLDFSKRPTRQMSITEDPRFSSIDHLPVD